jgi:hypothetical protein
MFLIRTRLGPSAIHGIGVFADEPAAAGQEIWRFAPGIDQVISLAQAGTLPEAFRHYLATYAYLSPAFPGCYVLSGDHAKFMNHAEAPNTAIDGHVTRAAQAIAVGDEVTCDYRLFVEGWTGFD